MEMVKTRLPDSKVMVMDSYKKLCIFNGNKFPVFDLSVNQYLLYRIY